MIEVEKYFNRSGYMNATNKNNYNVYLASDEVIVLKKAKKYYSKYNLIYDETHAESAKEDKRYSELGAENIIADIYFLSQCDYLVCTFSSQVCRLAYELMQTRYADASWRFKSLDDIYYFGEQNQPVYMAILDHWPTNNISKEIEILVNDKISVYGNHWNGYFWGKNEETGIEGFFPTYKVKELIQEF